jgi:hypothetical protein
MKVFTVSHLRCFLDFSDDLCSSGWDCNEAVSADINEDD